MNEVMSTVVSVEPDAREFIRAKGGDLYVWIGASGFKRIGFDRPMGADFIELRGDGFSLFQDTTIFPPRRR